MSDFGYEVRVHRLVNSIANLANDADRPWPFASAAIDNWNIRAAGGQATRKVVRWHRPNDMSRAESFGAGTGRKCQLDASRAVHGDRAKLGQVNRRPSAAAQNNDSISVRAFD